MKTIRAVSVRYSEQSAERIAIELPRGARIFHVMWRASAETRGGYPGVELFALVDTDEETVARHLLVVVGHEHALRVGDELLPNGPTLYYDVLTSLVHLGSCDVPLFNMVHVFEIQP